MTTVRSALLPLAFLGLSACSGAMAPTPMARYPAAGAATPRPLASLPAAAGRVVAVRRTDYANGVSETLVLEGPHAMAGENDVTIAAVSPGAATGPRDRSLDIAPPSDTALEAEMLARFPGVPMTISADMERNTQGPFGYATGSAGPLTCLYAWQYLAPARSLSLIDGLIGARPAVTSVRVRLCREEPAAALLGLVRDLSLARREDGSEPFTPADVVSAGDALDAALAWSGGLQSPTFGEPRAPAVRMHGPRRHRLVLTNSLAPRHRPRFRHVGPRRTRRPDIARDRRGPDSGATRVPLPGEVATGTGRPTADLTKAPAPASDRIAVVGGPMPLPR